MTNAEARFNIALRPRKPEGSLGRTAQDGYLDSHTAPELCVKVQLTSLLLISPGICYVKAVGLDDDELMLNVLRCHETY